VSNQQEKEKSSGNLKGLENNSLDVRVLPNAAEYPSIWLRTVGRTPGKFQNE
jgi:hypothetical protein